MSAPQPDVGRTLDMVLVQDLIARIAHLADEGDLNDYVAAFADDAVWRMPANPAIGVPVQERVGIAAIRAGAAERRAAGVQGPGSAARHVVGVTSVDVDGDMATALSYFRFYLSTTSDPRLVSMGTYRDVFRRVDHRWRLASRTIGFG